MGHGQPRVTIRTNLLVLSHLMLQTKFQGNQPLSCRNSYARQEQILALHSKPQMELSGVKL